MFIIQPRSVNVVSLDKDNFELAEKTHQGFLRYFASHFVSPACREFA